MNVVYEDNHLIIVNKQPGEIVQGDKTGDATLADSVKAYIKEKYAKPGAVYLGVAHRLDRPVSGVVLFARTSKALTRLNDLFRNQEVKKTYWAIVQGTPEKDEGLLTHYLLRNEQQNKSYVCPAGKTGAKQAVLDYKLLTRGDRYSLLEVHLHTGRHHQIRCQLAAIGCPVKGDLKYGAARSNPGGGISLHARQVSFVHPVSQQPITITAPTPEDEPLWDKLLTIGR